MVVGSLTPDVERVNPPFLRSAIKRELEYAFKHTLASLFIVFMLGVLLDYAFTVPKDRDWMTAGAIAVGLYLTGSLTLWAINSLSGALYSWLFARDWTNAVLAMMYEAQMPPPTQSSKKSAQYFADLASDSSVEIGDRLKGAAFFAALRAHKANMGIFMGRAYEKAADAAVLRYYVEAPARRRTFGQRPS